MIKKFLVISLVINLIMAALLMNKLDTPIESEVFVATEAQIECLEKWKKVNYEKKALWGPESFSKHFVVFDDSSRHSGSFEMEMSGCFYSVTMNISRIEQIQATVQLLHSQGYEKVSFYKSPDENTIKFYAK